jgi:hypothetical protein
VRPEGFRERLHEEFDDAIYGMKAWSQAVPWLTVFGGVGLVITGWANRDPAMFASGATAVVVAFIPRAKPQFVYEVARTIAIRAGWIALPASEDPLVNLRSQEHVHRSGCEDSGDPKP